MKTVLIFVSTIDGKITRWGDRLVKNWSSKEDQKYFDKVWDEARLIVMGSTTFDPKHVSGKSKAHFVIMTKHAEEYERYAVPGKVEFTGQSPRELSSRFFKEGYETMVVVGGPHVATSFIMDQLIDELWLTLEPKIFGTGGGFVIEEKLDVDLKLISCEKVNDRGTLITKYAVIK